MSVKKRIGGSVEVKIETEGKATQGKIVISADGQKFMRIYP